RRGGAKIARHFHCNEQSLWIRPFLIRNAHAIKNLQIADDDLVHSRSPVHPPGGQDSEPWTLPLACPPRYLGGCEISNEKRSRAASTLPLLRTASMRIRVGSFSSIASASSMPTQRNSCASSFNRTRGSPMERQV